jgi:hypothetical protein
VRRGAFEDLGTLIADVSFRNQASSTDDSSSTTILILSIKRSVDPLIWLSEATEF